MVLKLDPKAKLQRGTCSSQILASIRQQASACQIAYQDRLHSEDAHILLRLGLYQDTICDIGQTYCLKVILGTPVANTLISHTTLNLDMRPRRNTRVFSLLQQHLPDGVMNMPKLVLAIML